MATDSLPLPHTFTHISVHMIHILARLQAKRLVQDQLRAEGIRLSLVSPREVQERATAYLAQRPDLWKEAIARAHRLDEMEILYLSLLFVFAFAATMSVLAVLD